MFCRIADFDLEIDLLYPKTAQYFKDWEIPNPKTVDKKFGVNSSQIEREKNTSLVASEEYFEFIAIQRKISEWLPTAKTILLHSAVFEVNGIGVAFAAPSGTGKTTHMALWKKLLGEEMRIINGDKPFVRFVGNTPYAYGTPWRGKENLGLNSKTELRHICLIERANENSCEEMSSGDAADFLFRQIYLPHNKTALENTLEYMNVLLGNCRFWKIRCNMDIEAAAVSYNKIFENK